EPVYGMLLVRCPECSAPAAIQEYPVLGHWANRWAALLAAIWFVLLLASVAGTSGLLGGMSAAATQAGLSPFATAIAERYTEYHKGLDAAARAKLPPWIATTNGLAPGPYTWIELSWWRKQDYSAIL